MSKNAQKPFVYTKVERNLLYGLGCSRKFLFIIILLFIYLLFIYYLFLDCRKTCFCEVLNKSMGSFINFDLTKDLQY